MALIKIDQARDQIPDIDEQVKDEMAVLCARYIGHVSVFWQQLRGELLIHAGGETIEADGWFRIVGGKLTPMAPLRIKRLAFADNPTYYYGEKTCQMLNVRCLTPVSELDVIVPKRTEFMPVLKFVYGNQPLEVTPDDVLVSLPESEEEVVGELCEYLNNRSCGVLFRELKLHSWPIDGDINSLTEALRRSKWISCAVVSKNPLTVNPALLAYKLQEKKKHPQVKYTANRKQLEKHLETHFPSYVDEFIQMVEYGQ